MCVKCRNRVKYVSKSERACAYSAHNPGQRELCVDSMWPGEESNNHIANEKSDFHTRWQSIFPGKNVEIPFEKDGEKRYADIFINGRVIEIQHSAIDSSVVQARNAFYSSQNLKITWIVDIEPYDYHIEEIITYKPFYKLIS